MEMTIGSPFLLKWNSAKITDRNNPPNIADNAPRKALFAKKDPKTAIKAPNKIKPSNPILKIPAL